MVNPYSLYFHVPFCTKKCEYCHFFVLPNHPQEHRRYLYGLELEGKLRSHLFQSQALKSIYFGGGTPSLLSPDILEEILSWIAPDKEIEITLEANPETLNRERLKAFRQLGINRLSIGAQSFDDSELKLLSRTHDSQTILKAISQSHDAGFENISIDLMYDLPTQTLTSWQKTLNTAGKLPITHLSLYNLTIEPETVFFKRKKEIVPKLPDPEMSLAMYQMAEETLSKTGLHPYEISAFSKPNFHSIHNKGYWTARPFIGFGPSAFSFWNHVRFRNVPHMNKYIQMLEEGKDPADLQDVLSKEDRKKELLAVEIRLREGVHIPTFEKRHGVLTKEIWDSIKLLKEKGWIEENNDSLFLTKNGILFYDSVASEIV